MYINLRSRRVPPVKVLSVMALIVPMFVMFVYFFTSHGTSNVIPTSLGPANKTSVFHVNWDNAVDQDRTAYLYTYMYGRSDDRQRFIATLTSIESVRLTATKRKIIVMVSNDTPDYMRTKFIAHGATVQIMPDDDMIHPSTQITGVVGDCKANFAPIFAWSLYDDYDRVIWLDADVLAQLNLDELFLCGEFCMTYANLMWYSTSMLVVKPDQHRYNELRNIRNNIQVATELRDLQFRHIFTSPSPSACQTIFDTYILHAYYPIESAPLFTPTKGQQDTPVMRLSLGYNVNPIFWYEKYDWSLARAKDYSHMQSESEYDIPAHSISWPSIKPYDWVMAIYWNMNWVWAHWRRTLIPEDYFEMILGYLTLTGIIYALTVFGIKFCMGSRRKRSKLRPTASHPPPFTRDPSEIYRDSITDDVNINQLQHGQHDDNSNSDDHDDDKNNSPSSPLGGLSVHERTTSFSVAIGLMKCTSKLGPNIVGSVLGAVIVFSVMFASAKIIPNHTIYYVAWPLYIILNGVMQQCALMLFSAFLFYLVNGTQGWDSDEEQYDKQNETVEEKAWNLLSYFTNSVDVREQLYLTILKHFTPGHRTLTPQTQKILLSSITHVKYMFQHIIILSFIYMINQWNIYPHFAFKIICVFLEMLFYVWVLIHPYIYILYVMFYAKSSRHNWR